MSGAESGRITFTHSKWVTASGSAPAGHLPPTPMRLISSSILVWHLAPVPTPRRRCVFVHWTAVLSLAFVWSDYGCGSGILGIAAARLGAGAVLGVDNDPQAMTASRDNASRNQVPETTFTAVLPDAEVISSWAGSAEWVVANILAGPLVDLMPILTTFLAPGGRVLLAGLLAEQAEAVIEAYSSTVDLAIADQQEEWVLLAGARR